MCASIGFFANLGLNSAEKKVLKGKLPIDELSKRYHALSQKLDASAHAALFARAATLMKDAGHPDKAFEFYMLAAENCPQSQSASYKKLAVIAHPGHYWAHSIAQSLANDMVSQANELVKLLALPVLLKNGLSDAEYRAEMCSQVTRIRNGAQLYADAASIISSFSPLKEAYYLQSGISILEILLSSDKYYSYFPTKSREIIQSNLDAMEVRMHSIGIALGLHAGSESPVLA